MKYIKNLNIIILSKWLMLAFILFSIVSCSGIKSVRTKNSFTNKSKITDKNDLVKITEDKKNNQENKEIISNNLPNEFKTIKENDIVRDIPTIKEQLNNLIENNEIIYEDIKSLKNKIADLENKFNKIEYQLDLVIDSNPKIPETGEKKDTKPKNNEFKFYPDNNKEYLQIAEKETFLKNEELNKNNLSQKSKKNNIKLNTPKTLQNSNSEMNSKNNNLEDKNIKLELAKEEFKKGNYENSKKLFLEAKSIETSRKNLSEIDYNLGEISYNLGNYSEAIKYFSNVILNNDSKFIATCHLKIAESNMRLGRIEEAKENYQKIVTNYPNSEYIKIARKMLQQL